MTVSVRLFSQRVVCTNFDIYVFILSLGYIRLHLFISYTMYVSLNVVFF
jgi:hypothetical protein